MKKINIIYKISMIFSITIVIFLTGLYIYSYYSPKIKLNSANSIYLYDYNNEIVFQTNNNSNWVTIDNISKDLINATISIEDKNFYKHKGFDYLRIIKALYNNIKHKTIVEGASTISQQYVKNLYLDFKQTWKRKFEEAILTINLETHYSKNQILEGYLNTINYGQGNYGIQNASHFYFNKDARELTLEEAIILAGIPRSPENNNPVGNYENAIKRGKIVASSMVKNGYLKKENIENLFKENIEIYGKKETNNTQTFMYYYDAVMEEVNNISSIPKSLIKSGGIKIYTNFNLNLQQELDKNIKENVIDDTQIASVIINPKTGGVMALAGGTNYSKSQYNRVTQAKRQVGSTIKPFLYYSALNNNMTAASTFLSEKTNFVFSSGNSYSPKNYSDSYAGKEITMAAALAYSDNVYAVKTHLFIGENELVNTLKEAGLKEKLNPVPSLALGAEEINMLDYAESYVTLANYGIHNNIHFIEKIEDTDGKILYKKKEDSKQVLDKANVFIINELLTNTYNPKFIDYQSPTILYLNSKISRKYAIKSGTTESDYWIVGYNPDILMLVWAGDDYNKNVDNIYSKNIKNIWCNTVESYLKTAEKNWYEIPDNVIGIPLNSIDGKIKENDTQSIIYYFKKGTEIIP